MIDLTAVIDNNKGISSIRDLRNEAKRATSGMIKDFQGVDVSVDEMAKSIQVSKKIVRELEKEYRNAQQALSQLPEGKKKDFLSAELKQIREDLTAERENLKYNEQALQQYRDAHASLRTQIAAVRNEMSQLELSGQRNSERYKELQDELSRLGTAYRKVQAEQKALTTGATQWQGIQSGLQGVMGAYAAGIGVIGLFTSNTEKLVKIQTQLQSVMGIIIGMSQLANTVHETSDFRMQTLTKVTELYNAANLKVASGLRLLGLSANAASIAAKGLMASLTLGLSVAITVAVQWISKLIEKHKETKQAAQEAAKAQRETFESYARSVASNSAEIITKFNALQQQYKALGDDLQAKKKFIKENADAFKELGVKVTDVNDAENLFIHNAEAFRKSIEARAQAAAAMELAVEKYKVSIQKMMEYDQLNYANEDNILDHIKATGYRKWSAEGLTEEQNEQLSKYISDGLKKAPKDVNERKIIYKQLFQDFIGNIAEGMNAESEALKKEAFDLIKRSLGFQKEASNKLSEAGIGTAEEINNDSNRLAELISKLTADAQEARINVMDDEFQKELELIKLQYDRREAEIKKREDELRRLQGGALSEQQIAEFGQLRAANEKIAADAVNKFIEDYDAKYSQKSLDDWNKYLREYGNFEERRLALIEYYDKKIAEAKTEGDKKYWEAKKEEDTVKADERAMNEYLAKYGSFEEKRLAITKIYAEKRAKANNEAEQKTLDQEEKQALDKINQEEKRASATFKKIFGDIGAMSRRAINEAITAAYQELANLDPEAAADEYKALSDQIERLVNARDNMDFSGWESGILAVLKNYRALTSSVKEYNIAASRNDKEAMERWAQRVEFEKQQLKQSLVVTGVDQFANGLGQAADYMKEIADLTGNTDLDKTASMLSAAASNLQAAGQGFASGGWIGAIVGGVSNIIEQSLTAAATIKGSIEEAKQNVYDYANAIKLLSYQVNDDDYDTIFGTKSLSKAADAYKAAQNAYQDYQDYLLKRSIPEIKKEFNSLGAAIFGGGAAGLAEGSIGWGIQKQLTNEYKTLKEAFDKGYTDLQAMAIKTKDVGGWGRFWGLKDKYTSLKDLAEGMWDDNGQFNVDAAKAFLETNTQITEEQRKQIQNAIDLYEAYEDAMSQLDTIASDIFSEMTSTMSEAIFDAVENGADAWDDFEASAAKTIRNIAKMMLQEWIVGEYLSQYEESFKAALGENDIDKMTEIIGQMAAGFPEMYEQGTRLVKEMYDAAKEAGVNMDLLSDSNGVNAQTATVRGFQAMSQDTGDELNGRFTAIQGDVHDIHGFILSMSANNTLQLNETINIRDIMIQLNGNVADIRSYTRVLPDMSEILTSINKKLENI